VTAPQQGAPDAATSPLLPPAPPPEAALLARFVVVLVEPRVAVNVGTVIRAMKNMGLTRLRLVRPSPMAWARTQISAPRTLDIVEHIEAFATLDDAVADCHLLLGVTALMNRALHAPPATPRDAAPALVARVAGGEQVALLFGRESSGLHSDEVNRCDQLMTIPTRPDYTSLNLAQAVLLTCYELRLAACASVLDPNLTHAQPAPATLPSATADAPDVDDLDAPPTEAMRARLLAQAEHTLSAIRFFKSGAVVPVMVQLRRLLQRAAPSRREVRLLTGICVEVLKFAHLVRRGVIPTDLPAMAVAQPAPDPTPAPDPVIHDVDEA
jgi:tRNA (cytidine32/uridine32-2'-O)-methyltransferase